MQANRERFRRTMSDEWSEGEEQELLKYDELTTSNNEGLFVSESDPPYDDEDSLFVSPGSTPVSPVGHHIKPDFTFYNRKSKSEHGDAETRLVDLIYGSRVLDGSVDSPIVSASSGPSTFFTSRTSFGPIATFLGYLNSGGDLYDLRAARNHCFKDFVRSIHDPRKVIHDPRKVDKKGDIEQLESYLRFLYYEMRRGYDPATTFFYQAKPQHSPSTYFAGWVPEVLADFNMWYKVAQDCHTRAMKEWKIWLNEVPLAEFTKTLENDPAKDGFRPKDDLENVTEDQEWHLVQACIWLEATRRCNKPLRYLIQLLEDGKRREELTNYLPKAKYTRSVLPVPEGHDSLNYQYFREGHRERPSPQSLNLQCKEPRGWLPVYPKANQGFKGELSRFLLQDFDERDLMGWLDFQDAELSEHLDVEEAEAIRIVMEREQREQAAREIKKAKQSAKKARRAARGSNGSVPSGVESDPARQAVGDMGNIPSDPPPPYEEVAKRKRRNLYAPPAQAF